MNAEDEVINSIRSISCRKWGVERPAEIGTAAFHKQGRNQDCEGKRQDPETKVIHSRKRHIWRPDHHRNHPICQADKGRHNSAKHHD